MQATKANDNIKQGLAKLNELYDKEEKLIFEIQKIYNILIQTQEDIELAELMIMHQANKKERVDIYGQR